MVGPVAQSSRHHGPLPSRPEIFGARDAVQAGPLYRMARSKAYLFRGVEIRWSCDPALLKEDDTTPAQEVLHFPNGLADFLAADARRPSQLSAADPSPAMPTSPTSRARWNGRWPGPRTRKASAIPTAIPCRRPKAAPTRPACATRCCAALRQYGETGQQPPRRPDHRRRRDRRRGHRVVALHPRAAVPGADQGKAGQRGGDAPCREFASRITSTISCRAIPAAANALLAHLIERADDRLREKTEQELAKKPSEAPAPSRQARRLHLEPRQGNETILGRRRFGRRLGQAGPQPRNSGDPALARQNPQRRFRQRRQDARQPGNARPDRGARLRPRAIPTTMRSCATSASSS